MKFAFIDAEKAHFPVSLLCRVLQVSRSGFYAWHHRRPSTRSQEDAALRVRMEAHDRSRRTYGSPRIYRALRNQKIFGGRKRVVRLMREEKLVAGSGADIARPPWLRTSRSSLPTAASAVAATATTTPQWRAGSRRSSLSSASASKIHDAKEKLFDYIEVFYNQSRMHSSIGYAAPAEFERAEAEKPAA